MNAERLKELRAEYLRILQSNLAANPEAYAWARPMVVHGNLGDTTFPAKTPEGMADKMMAAVQANSFTLDANSAPSLNEAVRCLGIKPTKKALLEWLNAA